MSEELLSHPDRSLEEHVGDVREAAAAILALHSGDPGRDQVVFDTVGLHDLGKTTPEFQRYIRNPEGFKGSRDKKAHTPIGFAAALLVGRKLGWSPSRTLQVAAAILGHHTRFPTARRMTNDYFMSDKWAEIIEDQAEGIPSGEASEITGFDLADILSDPDICDEACESAEAMMQSTEELADEDLGGAVAARLKAQFVFSVLLEADKAFLALSNEARASYRAGRSVEFSERLVEDYLSGSATTEINELRTEARREAAKTLADDPDNSLWTLTLPTGLGKTLTAATLAFGLRESLPAPKRRIFIVLPFLSIIDQTAKVYGEVLRNPPTSTLLESHSLSERTYDSAEGGDAEFLLDTWDSEIVITTFDQLLLSLLGDRSRHQMRFHNLADSIIIFDEVQTIPVKMWDLLDNALSQLTKNLNTTAIIMSATQPGFVTGARELIEPPKKYYGEFRRYRFVLKHRSPLGLQDFIEEIRGRREELENMRVMVTLNTRNSARHLFDNIVENWESSVYFLSADVTPRDRLAKIEKIKARKDEPCLVVSTQVVEAGVDIDMDLVLRDFAPLDSLVQVAGRCNRNGTKPRCDVEIYTLTNDRGRAFSEMVYTVERGSPDVRLQMTREILDARESIIEENILEVCDEYFSKLRSGKDTGRMHTLNWATLAEDQPDVRTLLRGEQGRQIQLIVASRDDGDLRSDIENALAIPDRWQRRSVLRGLAGRIARVTVSVWVRKDWHPENIAEPIGNYSGGEDSWKHPWWIVYPYNYTPERGIETEGSMFI